MGDCEQSVPDTRKKQPRATITLRWDEEVVLKKGNITATLTITNDGNVVGKVEKEVKI